MNKSPLDWTLSNWQLYLQDKIGTHFDSIDYPIQGNMNLTIRLKNKSQSIIVKHAPPFCAKFPDIPAPRERLKVEYLYYKQIEKNIALKNISPEMIFFDKDNNILGMQDLGTCKDYTYLYQCKDKISLKTLSLLANYLNNLHSIHVKSDRQELSNTLMRQLNHQYIFDLPLRDLEFNLELLFPTKHDYVLKIKKDKSIRQIAKNLGEIYLKEGKQLIHGDFYPSSWITNNGKLYVIDPEFCFIGLAEFDLSVLFAHLLLSCHDKNEINHFRSVYTHHVDFDLIQSFTASEIVRRLIYVSQLPLNITEDQKIYLLSQATQVLKGQYKWF